MRMGKFPRLDGFHTYYGDCQQSNVAPAPDTPVMSPARCATQLIHAAAHEPADVYRDLCATIAALATISDVQGTARLLELLANAAAKEPT